MKRIITILVVAALLTAIVSAGFSCRKSSAKIAAGTEFSVNGTTKVIKVFMDPDPKIAGTTMSGLVTDYMEVHGDMEGAVEILEIAVVDMTTGKFTSEGVGTFTGKVMDREGSFVYRFTSSGQFTSPTGDTGVTISDATVVRGMGGLAGCVFSFMVLFQPSNKNRIIHHIAAYGPRIQALLP
jgi:hypothetical protein